MFLEDFTNPETKEGATLRASVRATAKKPIGKAQPSRAQLGTTR